MAFLEILSPLGVSSTWSVRPEVAMHVSCNLTGCLRQLWISERRNRLGSKDPKNSVLDWLGSPGLFSR